MSLFSPKSEREKVNGSDPNAEYASESLKKNTAYIQEALNETSDLVIKWLKDDAVLMYLETLVDQEKVERRVLDPLYDADQDLHPLVLKAPQTPVLADAVHNLLQGHSVLLVEGDKQVYLFDTTGAFDRQIEEPDNEKVVRGAHSGFVENLLINVNLIRKRIEDQDLCVRYYKLGKKTKTNAAIVYMKGLADPTVLELINKRMQSISSDFIMSPGFIEEFIEDSPFSPFPQSLNTERPDRATANIMEGRVALVAEGSPAVLILPVTFFTFYQSPDDYNSRWIPGTFIRLLRITSFLIAIMLPSFYIAIAGFHFEVIPTELVIPLKTSVEDIPYPPIIEALFMAVTIELIREAGIRLPTSIGQTIGIVGGLVIGNAVVMAGLISNIMIIIIAVTAISSFVVPSNEMSTSLRILTFPLMFMASALGFVGIVFTLMFILIHLCKLESFGTPYFAPFAPFQWKDIKDTFVRVPLWLFNDRPRDAHPQRKKREWKSRRWKNDGR
ncbi:MAG TPA: spore germination protein [Bacillales bacterium]|nr:spore germination protein [Bacillales bacterium]